MTALGIEAGTAETVGLGSREPGPEGKRPDPDSTTKKADMMLEKMENDRKRLIAIQRLGQDYESAPRFDADGFDHHAPCPICNGIEGCSHSIAERKAAINHVKGGDRG